MTGDNVDNYAAAAAAAACDRIVTVKTINH